MLLCLLLYRCNLIECLIKIDEYFSDPTYFRSLAGKLQYLTLTRPDLQFAVNLVCQRMHKPTMADFHILKRVLRYIKGTINMGLHFYSNSDSSLKHYVIMTGQVAVKQGGLREAYAHF